MAEGAGKYDSLCTNVRRATQAEGVIVLIIDGTLGSGFSVQANAEITRNLPEILDNMAQQIRDSL